MRSSGLLFQEYLTMTMAVHVGDDQFFGRTMIIVDICHPFAQERLNKTYLLAMLMEKRYLLYETPKTHLLPCTV
jgi:hypothetical protein